MSGRIVGEVLANAPDDLTPGELLVLVVIAEDARERDRRAEHCDVENIAYLTRLRPGTVRNALSSLTRRALIEPLRKTTYRGGFGWQEYRITALHPHHRSTANVSLLSDAPRHRTVTRSPVDKS